MSDYFTMMNGLGGLGFSGMYDPTMMSMYGGLNGLTAMNPYGGGYSGMGFNPAFMAQQYAQVQQQVEKSQAQHAIDMHDITTQARVQNLSAEDRAYFESIAQDAGVKRGIQDLADAIREHNKDLIKEKYDNVKMMILTKYNAYYRNNAGKIADMEVAVRDQIENLYDAVISKNSGGASAGLKSDIDKYCEDSVSYGINKGLEKGLFGKQNDYHESTKHDVLNYIYHTPMDNQHGEEKKKKLGKAIGIGARYSIFAAPIGLFTGIKHGGWAGLGAYLATAIGTAAVDWLWQKA